MSSETDPNACRSKTFTLCRTPNGPQIVEGCQHLKAKGVESYGLPLDRRAPDSAYTDILIIDATVPGAVEYHPQDLNN